MKITEEVRRQVLQEYFQQVGSHKNPRKGFGSNPELARELAKKRTTARGFNVKGKAAEAARARWVKWRAEKAAMEGVKKLAAELGPDAASDRIGKR